MTIYHLVWQKEWDQSVRDELYHAPSLESEGFVHCTREREKVAEVANLFFRPGDDELLLISLNEESVGSVVKDEDPGVGHLFPHVYGPIDVAAVVETEVLKHDGVAWQVP